MRVDTNPRLASLLGLGLTEAGAKVYLALLQHPRMSAAALVKAAGVPRSHVYRVLDELHVVGLVEVIADEARRSFRARPLSDYLQEALARHETKMQMTRAAIENLGDEFSPPPADGDGGATANARILLGRRAVAREIDAFIDSAQSELVVGACERGWARMRAHLSRGENGAGRSIRARVAPAVLADAAATLGSGSDVRALRAPIAALILVIDRASVLLVHPIPNSIETRTGSDFGTVVTDPVIAESQVLLLDAAADGILCVD